MYAHRKYVSIRVTFRGRVRYWMTITKYQNIAFVMDTYPTDISVQRGLGNASYIQLFLYRDGFKSIKIDYVGQVAFPDRSI